MIFYVCDTCTLQLQARVWTPSGWEPPRGWLDKDGLTFCSPRCQEDYGKNWMHRLIPMRGGKPVLVKEGKDEK